MPKYVPRLEGIMHDQTLNVFGDLKKLNLSKMYLRIARFIQNVLRSTLLHANKTTKKCIEF